MIHIGFPQHTPEVKALPDYEQGKGNMEWLNAHAPLAHICEQERGPDGTKLHRVDPNDPDNTTITLSSFFSLVSETTGELMGDHAQLLEETAEMVRQAVIACGGPDQEVCHQCLIEAQEWGAD